MVPCSVVIRTCNEAKYIGRLFTGIENQTIKDVEVIIVDSGSRDDTVTIAVENGAKVVSIDPESFSYGRSLNLGVAESRGKFVINVSAHCYPVYPDWLKQLVKPFADPEVALSYGKQRGGDTNRYSELQFFEKYFPDISQPKQGNPYSHNANACIRRDLWEQRQYNENVTGLEDLIWSSWVQYQGFKIAYVAEAEVIHVHNEGPLQVYNRYCREAVSLRDMLPRSSFTLKNFFSMWLGSTFSDLNKARREGVFGKVWFSILWFRLMQYLGTYRGYNYPKRHDIDISEVFDYQPSILDEKKPTPRNIKPLDYDTLKT
jgi:glycosyltransferase involved in cell wall biosynthesis